MIFAPSIRSKQIFRVNLFTWLAIATIFIVLTVTSCVGGQSNELQPLRIGITTWPGFDISIYGQTAGLFKRRGLDVNLVRFENQQDSARAVLRGSLDAAFTSFWDVKQVDPGNDKPVLIIVTNISSGADGLVTQPQIKSVKELRGKRVAAKLGTVNHLILLEALRANQIKPAEVEIEDIANETAAKRMTGEIKGKLLDGAILWQPLLGEVAKSIGGNIPFTTKEVDSLVIDTLMSSNTIVGSKRTQLTNFILAWFDIMNAVENKPTEVFNAVGKQLGQSGESFASDYAGLKKGDINLNRRMFESNGRLQEASKLIDELLKEDPRHRRIVRKDVEIDSELVTAAIKAWKP